MDIRGSAWTLRIIICHASADISRCTLYLSSSSGHLVSCHRTAVPVDTDIFATITRKAVVKNIIPFFIVSPFLSWKSLCFNLWCIYNIICDSAYVRQITPFSFSVFSLLSSSHRLPSVVCTACLWPSIRIWTAYHILYQTWWAERSVTVLWLCPKASCSISIWSQLL